MHIAPTMVTFKLFAHDFPTINNSQQKKERTFCCAAKRVPDAIGVSVVAQRGLSLVTIQKVHSVVGPRSLVQALVAVAAAALYEG